MKISKKENDALTKIKKQKIKIILNIPKNNECFECSNLYPEFISLNNGIFLCRNCVKNHSNFPKSISNILKKDLNDLTLKNIQYLCCGGNEKLKQFIQNEFPKLKKIDFKNLYKTYAMDYYRKYLEYLIEGGIKPNKPNKSKAYELIKINNNNNLKKKNNNKKDNEDDELYNNHMEMNVLYNKRNPNLERKSELFKFTKSSDRHKSNLNLILSNFNNSLNNFNTINIYNYNDKIFTETYCKKRFFSQIFNDIDDMSDSNNLNNINNITFNKEENNDKKSSKKHKKLDTNIKVIKRKDFLNKQSLNHQKSKSIYHKPLFQNYINAYNQGNKNNDFEKNNEISSPDLKYFSNDIKEMNKSNTMKIFINKNLYSSKKIFKKKTVGNSFSIQYPKHQVISPNNSIEKNHTIAKDIFNFRNSNKVNLKNKITEEIETNNSFDERGKIKVNRQLNINKYRKRNSLNNIIMEKKYGNKYINEIEKERKYKKLDNIQKEKIIERIHRVSTNKKEQKNIKSFQKDEEIKHENLNDIILNNSLEKDHKIKNKTKTKLSINNMNNNKSTIKKNILEVIKSNNLSNLIISSNSKKLNSVFDEPKTLTKNNSNKKI